MNQMFPIIPDHLFWGATIVGTVAGISVITRVVNSNPGRAHSPDLLLRGGALMKQAFEWHAQSQQDTDPLFAMRHSDYALAYLNAARSILPDHALQRLSGIDVHDTVVALEAHQNAHTGTMSKICPPSNPKKKTSSVSWV